MNDFEFYNPTRIVFGRGKESTIGTELSSAGISKVLLVYGGNSAIRSGLIDRVRKSLAGQGVTAVEHGGVTSNPVLSHTREGVEMAKTENVQAVLAVGGGSTLDESKAIAAGALADHDVWDFFEDTEVSKALPLFTILTLAATGSEMNNKGVVTNEETKQKYNFASPLVYPRVSILNPELTCTVPPDYSAYSAVDAISHVIEGYFTREYSPALQDRLVETIVKSVRESSDIFLREPDNYDARAEFMWAATLALNGLTTAGIGPFSFPNHMIEHSLSAIYGIAHGAGLSIVIPAWLKWFTPSRPEQMTRFAREVFGLTTAEEGIDALETWFAQMGAPIRLADADIPESGINEIALNAFGLAKKWGIGKTYTVPVIEEILQLAV